MGVVCLPGKWEHGDRDVNKEKIMSLLMSHSVIIDALENFYDH